MRSDLSMLTYRQTSREAARPLLPGLLRDTTVRGDRHQACVRNSRMRFTPHWAGARLCGILFGKRAGYAAARLICDAPGFSEVSTVSLKGSRMR
jgi:hypothetical protein